MTSVVNRTMYPVQTSMNLISKMQQQFTTLQTQLSTGEKASNLAELGSDRYSDLSIRSRMSRLDGYSTNITMVNGRLDMFSQLTSRLESIESDARGLITPSTYGSEDVILGAVPAQARSNLDEVVNLLNSDINGRFLFGGGVTDKRPVANISDMLDGAGGKAGFAQVANERQQADVGGGLGRLTIGGTGDTVSLTEDAGPFGFKLASLTASSGAVTLTSPTGTPPQNLSVQFNSLPAAGDTVTIGLTLPDGTSDGITLKAVTGTPAAGEYQIGVDPATTAANFSAALQSSLTSKGGTTLVAASNNAAAENFFNAHGAQVMRVQGPNFATSTSLVAADPTTTVIWYTGGDSANPRSSIQARVDDTQTVNYGAQANESGTLNLVRSLAVLSIQSFSTSDPNTPGRFDAVASRNIDRLSESHNSQQGSLELLSIELNNAKVQIGDIKSRHTDYSAQLQGMLSGIENATPEEVTMQILALQTRLQASYQTTALVSKLSLVNYIQ
jgi:flagellar hook-associated protein 3 FlgL